MSQPVPLTSGPTTNTNGVLTAPSGRSAVGGNKKKAKRRAKAAAKAEVPQHAPPPSLPRPNGQPAQPYYPPSNHYHDGTQYADAPYDLDHEHRDHYDDQQPYSSEEDDDDDDDPMAYHSQNGAAYPHRPPPPAGNHRQPLPKADTSKQRTMNMLESALTRMREKDGKPLPQRQGNKSKQDRIWNTSTQEERERIKEFWLSLSENERKGLLKIEKNAVLNKMKEQQKHSCSCTVCGRKRTAIEEELEVLYDAYYEELAQYANQQPGEVGEKLLAHRRSSLHYPAQSVHAPRPLNTPHAPSHRSSRIQEVLEDTEQDDYSAEESYSEEDNMYSDEENYADEEYTPNVGAGFFDFGNNLTVKGGSFITDMLTHLHGRLNNLPDGILTVADDLLKNDGKKFIEMMEQLAERRMQREREVEYASHQAAHPNEPLDDEDDYDEDEEYDSAEEYDDDEEESDMGGLTDDQRMEEGRRMFQIFAARMFEQRVLTAYREKVAAERQAKLLEELEEEDKAKSQKDAKKAKEAEKKKNKKQAQKQAKAEERAKKDAEKAAEEAAAKAAEEQRLEEQRKRKEEQRRKKEAEKKAAEEDRLRKEADRLRRQQEERDRKAEEERKAKEAKAQEKRVKDDQRKKERDEREAREKEVREQKTHDDKMRKEQEVRERAPKAPTAQQPPQIIKRPSTIGQVAVPPALVQQKPTAPSPHIPIATPAIPKAPTPGVRTRQSSAQESSATSPRSSVPLGSKAKSPPTAPERVAPKQILQNPHKQLQQQQQQQQVQQQQHQPPAQPPQQRPSVSLPHPASHQGPPPGVHPPYQNTFGMGFPTFTGQQHSPAMHLRPGAQNGPQMAQAPTFRQPPPGVTIPPGGFSGRGFSDAPPGFPAQLSNMPVTTPVGPPARAPGQSHSRQHSATDNDMSPPPHVQPIGRPAPIQRPSSVKTGDNADDIDNLSKHLGSRALLDDDADDPLPPSASDLRIASNPIGGPRGPIGASSLGGFVSPHFGAPPSTFANPSSNWSTPTTFGPPSGLGGPPSSGPSWGASVPTSSWSTSATPFGNTLGAPGRGANNPPRSRALRLAVCGACRSLSSSNGQEYHDVSLVLAQISAQHGLPEGSPAPSLQELEDICETEGDALNGGGSLHCRRSGPRLAIRFDPVDHHHHHLPHHGGPGGAGPASNAGGGLGGASGVGEIGSPVLGNAAPGSGFGSLRGFGSGMGGLASPGGF